MPDRGASRETPDEDRLLRVDAVQLVVPHVPLVSQCEVHEFDVVNVHSCSPSSSNNRGSLFLVVVEHFQKIREAVGDHDRLVHTKLPKGDLWRFVFEEVTGDVAPAA